MIKDWRAKLFTPRDNLPADLTTIDYLKTAAIVLTIIDHVGYYLFPDIMWLRVIGRFCVPLWFFLIGYATTRELPIRWLIAALILAIASVAVGMSPLPLVVLVTMAASRALLDPFWRFVMDRPFYFWWIVLLLFFCGYATDMFMEYGTMGFLLACAGYALRHETEVEEVFGVGMPGLILAVALVAFGTLSWFKFGFDLLQGLVLFGGLVGIFFILQDFKAKTLPGTAGGINAPLIRFTGRYTLEIYVAHLLILKAVLGLKLLAAYLVG